MIECRHQLALRIVHLLKLRLHCPFRFPEDFDFTPRPPIIPTDEVESGGTDGGVNEGAIIDTEIASPDSIKRSLHHVFSNGCTLIPLAGIQENTPRTLCKTDV